MRLPIATFRTYDGADAAGQVGEDLARHPTPYAVIRFQKKSLEIGWAVLTVDDELIRRLRRATGAIAKTLGLARTLRNELLAPAFKLRAHTDSLSAILAPDSGSAARQPIALLDGPDHVQAVVTRAAAALGSVAGAPTSAPAFLFPSVTSDRESLAPDEIIELTLTLEQTAGSPLGPALPIRFPDGKETITLHAEVSSSELEPVDGPRSWTQDLVIDRALGCAPSRWSFRARARGDRRAYALLISFHAEGAFLGAASVLRPRSGAPQMPPAHSSSTPLALPAQTRHHRQVSIVEQGGGYRVWLYEAGAKVGEIDGEWRPDQTYFDLLENARTRQDMVGIGASLSIDLPPELRRFVERDESPIQFASNPRVAPFEWIQLRPAARGPFLGEACAVSRCTRAFDSFDQPLTPPRQLLCIRPEYPPPRALPSAALEEQWLSERFGAHVIKARTTGELQAGLATSDVGVIHFAGHADGSPAGLELQDNQVTPNAFHPGEPAMGAHPLFFLNGCRAGLGSNAPAMVSNFVRFLSASCAAVVAPLVSVSSPAALLATQIFYEALATEPVSQAVMRIRQAAATAPTEEMAVSLMSYVSFAAPSLQIDLRALA